MQLMSAHDERLADVHLSAGQGLVLRGQNLKLGANIKKRYEHAN